MLRAITQHHNVLLILDSAEFENPRQIDDSGTVKYGQFCWVKVFVLGSSWFRAKDEGHCECATLNSRRPLQSIPGPLLSLPYVKFATPLIESWTRSVPLFRIPNYSIFQDTPQAMYSFPPVALVLLGIGNFVGKELYFRGYLMEKSAFLGRLNWIVNSVLLALYHPWQVQQTWPMIGLVLAFGLPMTLRKDLYV